MPSPDDPNNYVIDIEEAAETSRLIGQDKFLTQAMGGPFPARLDLSKVRQLLDIGCGPGGWALNVAFTHPDIEVVGIEINETMVRYAFALARTQQIQNVTFEVMDATKPLNFQDSSFDLVNARLIFGFMDTTSWPRLLKECRRILRPGGILQLTEVEAAITNSLALQRMEGFLSHIMAQQGRTFSLDGHSFGITHMFGKLLSEAGFEHIQRHAFFIDGSSDSEFNYFGSKDAEVAYSLLKPYILKAGLVEEAEYDRLYTQMLIDMMSTDFAGLTYGLTAWAVKPLED